MTDPYQPQPYQPPQQPYPYYPPPPPPRTDGFAVASLVLGILWIWWLGSILAVIFGHVALSRADNEGYAGRGLAVAGLVLGYIGVGTLVLLFLPFAIVGIV
ncbi:DUF4190 domain-containing protein [Haloechinothrix salitolerans]|uniref:DUF4190 domain-containing protein n=1 Tax=Haloechinothrix salitolerans TaxID=926830 RepID=A0ABW2BZG0_9PSEU